MNERIKELANKAGYNDQIYDISREGLEKFAELIVKECIKELGYKSIELLDTEFYPHYKQRLESLYD